MSDYAIKMKKSMINNGIAQMFLAPPIDLDNELVALKAAMDSLPLVNEKFNEDDRPVQKFFQIDLSWKVGFLANLKGINGKFSKGAWNAYRHALSLVAVIEADSQLLEIGKQLEVIVDKAIQSVATQNVDNTYYQFYVQRIAEAQ